MQEDSFGQFEIFRKQGGEAVPEVSVVMSVHNGASQIDGSVQSILNQSYQDWEFLIVDDGSSDQTFQKLIDYQSKNTKITVIKNGRNVGLTKSLIRAISLARGMYIARQDVDDRSSPNRLARQVSLMPEHDFVCCRTRVNNIKISPKWVTTKGYPLVMRFKNPFIHGTFCFKKELYDRVGGYDPTVRYAQDYDLVWRIFKNRGSKMKYLTEVLYFSNKTDECISLAAQKEQSQFAHKIIAKYS